MSTSNPSAESVARPSIYLVDDDVLFLDSLKLLLQSIGHESHCFRSGEEFLQQLRPDAHGCLITDLHLDGGPHGDEVLLEVQRKAPLLSVIVISGSARATEAVRVLKSGATHFLEKPFSVDELRDAVELAFSQSKKFRIDLAHHEMVTKRLSSLSGEECHVMKLMLDGTPSKEATYKTDTSRRTMARRRKAVLEKMSVDSIIQLKDLLKNFPIDQFLSDPSNPNSRNSEGDKGNSF